MAENRSVPRGTRGGDAAAREVEDYTTGGKSTVDFGFVEDVERIDVGYPEVARADARHARHPR